MSGIAQIQLNARRAIHARLGRSATYKAPDGTVFNVIVRVHQRTAVNGKDGQGYASVQGGYARIVFSSEDIASAGITKIVRSAQVTLIDTNETYETNMPDETSGPLEVPWLATPKN